MLSLQVCPWFHLEMGPVFLWQEVVTTGIHLRRPLELAHTSPLTHERIWSLIHRHLTVQIVRNAVGKIFWKRAYPLSRSNPRTLLPLYNESVLEEQEEDTAHGQCQVMSCASAPTAPHIVVRHSTPGTLLMGGLYARKETCINTWAPEARSACCPPVHTHSSAQSIPRTRTVCDLPKCRQDFENSTFRTAQHPEYTSLEQGTTLKRVQHAVTLLFSLTYA